MVMADVFKYIVYCVNRSIKYYTYRRTISTHYTHVYWCINWTTGAFAGICYGESFKEIKVPQLNKKIEI